MHALHIRPLQVAAERLAGTWENAGTSASLRVHEGFLYCRDCYNFPGSPATILYIVKYGQIGLKVTFAHDV